MRSWIATTVSSVLAVGAVAAFTLVSAGSAQAAASCTTGGRLYSTTASHYHVVPAIGSSNFNCSLNTGNNSAAVSALQRTLNKCYGESLDVDGDFGTNTRNALKRAQNAAGVDDDGSYGPITRDAIKHREYWSSDGSSLGCSRIYL
jgi:peptidoglycan hydrolase-like protein with peptidoglycan-binding domain